MTTNNIPKVLVKNEFSNPIVAYPLILIVTSLFNWYLSQNTSDGYSAEYSYAKPAYKQNENSYLLGPWKNFGYTQNQRNMDAVFNFDLNRMNEMLDTEFETMPNDLETVEDVLIWLRS